MSRSRRAGSPGPPRRHRGRKRRRHERLRHRAGRGSASVVPVIGASRGGVVGKGKRVTLKGTVTQWVYMNPHCLISMDVKGEDGKVVNWVIETQAPGIMYPAGYRKDSFKPGDAIPAVVEPVKNGQPVGRIQTVVTAT